MGQFDPGRYRANVFVDTAWQRRGVGTALFEHMVAELAARDAKVIESFARETRPEVIAFLDRRGFRESLRTWELRLDLARFDPAALAPYADRPRAAGVEIVTLAQERARGPQAMRHAYELREAVMADIPSPIPHTPVPFDEFVYSTLESPRALPDAHFLAKAGEAYVGEADLRRPLEGPHLMHNVTGVLPAWRERGVAMALKLATIAYGRAGGYSEIRTWNAVRNAGMLAINERLGFVRQPAWITFERTLASPGGRSAGAVGGRVDA
ncbi:MAG: GNAT family N-acetyltransferase [Armatimonadota bacterium]